MLNSDFTLTEFVCPVPTCPQKASLETLLNLIRGNKSEARPSVAADAGWQSQIADAIAIVNEEELPIGIINCRSILTLIAEGWFKEVQAGEGSQGEVSSPFQEPRFTSKRKNNLNKEPANLILSGRSFFDKSVGIGGQTYDFSSLIEPTITIKLPIRLQEFLPYWQALIKKNENLPSYVVVNSEGKLLGLLDTQGLIRWLFSHLLDTQTTTLDQLYFKEELGSSSLEIGNFFYQFLLGFLEEIPLPLKLQSAKGDVLYQNRCWQEEISIVEELSQKDSLLLGQRSLPLPENKDNNSILKQWKSPVEFLLSTTEEKTLKKTSSYCLQGNYNSIAYLNHSSPTETKAKSGKILTKLEEAEGEGLCRELGRGSKLPSKGRNLQASAETSVPCPPLSPDSHFSFHREVSLSEEYSHLKERKIKWKKAASSPAVVKKERIDLDKEEVSSVFTTSPTGNHLSSITQGKIQTNSQSDWQYFKLPINLLLKNDLGFTNSSSYHWLVLALRNTQQNQVSLLEESKDTDLIRLNQLKDEFLATISHELKSPLTAIVGLSSLLKEEKLGTLNQRQVRYAELIHRSGQQLMSIVNDLFDLTRLATGKLKLHLEKVNLKNICEEAYRQLISKEKANQKSEIFPYLEHKFKFTIEPGIEVAIADKLRLRQLIIHLLNNAVKFTPPGGELGISVSLWTKWIAIAVWDTGQGIPEATQHLILEQFAQGELTPLTQGSCGLGLILAQQLAKAHGGDISFISQVGCGSEFTVLLPNDRENVSKHSLCVSEAIQGFDTKLENSNNRLILVIETVSSRIQDIVNYVQELGYHAIIARTAIEVLDKARQLKPSKIFLNPCLSVVDDRDVLSLLKSDWRTKDIPIWLLDTQEEKKENKSPKMDNYPRAAINKQSLAAILRPAQKSCSTLKSLTILRLYPELQATVDLPKSNNINRDLILNDRLYTLHHRVLEADSLDQAEILARIWKLDALILDGSQLKEPLQYLRSLYQHQSLAALPLVILDAQTTEAANQIDGLSVFPCLVSNNPQDLANVIQGIEIAAGIMSQRE
jgi:signal transduction histidine kinase/CheY-like chemotaxis protein